MTVFIRAAVEHERAEALVSAASGVYGQRVAVSIEEFRWVSGSPFAYWVSSDVRSLFRDLKPFAREGNAVKQGVTTTDDFRFLRASWEIRPSDVIDWPPFAKGGGYSLFYADLDLVVQWHEGGAEMYAFTGVSRHAAGAPMRNPSFYFRPGLTWPLRSRKFCPQVLPGGVITSTRGSGIFGPAVGAFAALGASSIADHLLKLLSGRLGYPQFDMGDVALLPFPTLAPMHEERLTALGHTGWSHKRSLDTISEVSHAFVVPAVLQVSGGWFADRVSAWSSRVASVEAELERVQSEIDELCFELYGISEEDRQAIIEGFSVSDESEDGSEGEDSTEEDDADESAVELDPVGLAAGLVSWAAGVAVGRFDVRLVTGERLWPSEPDPFDPLPVCSPATLTGGDGLPSQSPPDGYPLEVSPVVVDDPGHELQLAVRVRAVFDVVFGDDADRWWTEVGVVLDSKSGDVEAWLRKTFFDYHLRTYSKSRRKAPILWPLGTRSGSYRVWLYAHRATPDSLFRVLNDIVGPKLYVEERRLSDLRQEAGPSASQRKAIDAQETFVAELRAFRDELASVAPLWAPDLNDGVVIVLAPLWRLFAHHRGWSSELKDRWRKLAAGDYDWAQLAMRLWPERVIPKCAEDRSLAIAHGLEDVFWVADKDNSDKWQPRTVPTTPVEELIAARTNPTITTARQHPTP